MMNYAKTKLALSAAVALAALLSASCAGEDGTAGAPGTSCAIADNGDGTSTIACEDGTSAIIANGADGAAGADGADGMAGTSCSVTDNGDGTKTISCDDGTEVVVTDGSAVPVAEYVGMTACATCHEDEYERVTNSGHPYKLNFIGGAAPTALPNASLLPHGNFPSSPPVGYEWSDISYIIGGWGWKARFIDQQGYIITCTNGDVDADGDGNCDTTPSDFNGQWNLVDSSWAGYHRGEFQKQYNCGRCHTTGYDPDTPTTGMPGIAGSWSEPGVRCEACHGPGSLHVAAPRTYSVQVDRSAEMCGSCHIRGSESGIPASGGFIRHHEQWNEMFVTQKHSMDCVDCHDPHQSARYAMPGINPDRGMRVDCESCHFNEAANEASAAMASVACIDCHMPYITKSAVGDAASYRGDVRTHLFAINTDVTAGQFDTSGGSAMPYVSLEWACRSCHPESEAVRAAQTNSVRSDAELEARAIGYHDR